MNLLLERAVLPISLLPEKKTTNFCVKKRKTVGADKRRVGGANPTWTCFFVRHHHASFQTEAKLTDDWAFRSPFLESFKLLKMKVKLPRKDATAGANYMAKPAHLYPLCVRRPPGRMRTRNARKQTGQQTTYRAFTRGSQASFADPLESPA